MRFSLPRMLIAWTAGILLLASGGLRVDQVDADDSQATKLLVDIGTPGRRSVPIALPSTKGADPIANELWKVVRRDLELSGWFDIIDEKAFIEPATAGIRPGQFSFQDWKVPGAAVLAKTSVSKTPEKVRAEVWIYDVAGAKKLDARAFSGKSGAVRNVGHRVANAIVKAVTGQDSIFNTRFAAVSKRTGNKEIYLLDVDGYGVVSVTRNGSINLKPSWSPTGSALLYTSYRAGNPDLFVADLAKGTTRRLSSRTGLNIGGAWSPSGELIALTLSPGGNSDIHTIDPYAGRTVKRLTSYRGIDTSPTWSPDGSKLAFVSERSGSPQIYVMPAGGGEARRTSFVGSHNTDPAWSPDGERLAFVSRDGNFDVFTVGVDGRSALRVTQGQGDNEDPSWSPDGRYLAFASTRKGGSHVWLSTADGYHQVQVTQGSGNWSNPAWSPGLSW